MPAPSVRPLCLSIGLSLLLAGCSAVRPSALTAAAPRTQALAARSIAPDAIEGPLTACRVLAATHVLARTTDRHAAFTTLVGTHIGAEGLPLDGGGWEVHYVSTEPVHGAARKPGVPSLPLFRHMTISANAAGHVRIEVAEQPGMPLGQAFFDAPMPRIDSRAAIAHARTMRPTQPSEGEFQLTLGGSVSPAHFQELVWKVQAPVQSGLGRPVVFSASTGMPIER
jgi:hypothetical protein